jgi:hypothetical protein
VERGVRRARGAGRLPRRAAQARSTAISSNGRKR